MPFVTTSVLLLQINLFLFSLSLFILLGQQNLSSLSCQYSIYEIVPTLSSSDDCIAPLYLSTRKLSHANNWFDTLLSFGVLFVRWKLLGGMAIARCVLCSWSRMVALRHILIGGTWWVGFGVDSRNLGRWLFVTRLEREIVLQIGWQIMPIL